MKTNIIKNKQALGFQWKTQDPFLFCAHHHDFYPEGNENLGPKGSLEGRNIGSDFDPSKDWRMYHGTKVPGFPAHPHKGFETVTIVEEGLADHSDSLGAAGRFGNGDVQWMTAGGGVMHCEMFPLLHQQKENTLMLFQIWLNLPKAKKSVPAHFKMLWNEDIPVHTHADDMGNKTSVKIIAGNLSSTNGLDPAPDSWAVDQRNEVAIWIIRMEPLAQWELPIAGPGINRSLFFYKGGQIKINEENLQSGIGADLLPDQRTILTNGNEAAELLFLQGRPIGEKVVQHGPFVMNSNLEIQEAVHEYQRTQFGGWPWPSHEHTHPKEKGRFALHADGREEVR